MHSYNQQKHELQIEMGVHSVSGVTPIELGINFIVEAIIIKWFRPVEFNIGHTDLWFWFCLFGLVNAEISLWVIR